MAILVSGGAGYIGSHTVVQLLNAGNEVVIVDDYSNSKPSVLERIKKIASGEMCFHEGDIADTKLLDTVFTEHDIEAVIHFAAYKAVGESVAKPLMYYRNNLLGLINVLEAMEKYGCQQFIYSSSATVYGNNNPVPFTEEMSTSAINPYGQTKVMGEQILRDVALAHPEWSLISLRYFNPIGAHVSGLIGEDPSGIPNNIMPYITQVAVGKLKELTVFGDDYETVDGTGVRDYIHVEDLASGHLAALTYAKDHSGIEFINLGRGHGYSVLELVHAFEDATGRKIPMKFGPRRPGDAAMAYADVKKAKALLDWQAQYDIADMCRDSWRWQAQNPQGYPDGEEAL